MKNPISSNYFGSKPVFYAALYGNLEIVKFLADLTDTPNSKDNNGATPIHNAAMCGHLEIVKFTRWKGKGSLIERG